MASIAFGIRCLREIVAGQPRDCPYCGSASTTLLQRKKVLLELRHCENCNLMFRYPKDNAEINDSYYQSAYRQGVTTDMPDAEELAALIDQNFQRPGNDMAHRLELLRQLQPQGRILDFGCSWGYASWQMREAGYDVVGYEVSLPRAGFARDKLDLAVYSSLDELIARERGMFDVVYSSHVLEHLPDLATAFSAVKALLKAEGSMLVFVPNCGSTIARQLGTGWGTMISETHCNALDARFLSAALAEHGFETKFAAPEAWTQPDLSQFKGYASPEQAVDDFPGEELGVWAKACRQEGPGTQD